MFKNTLQLFICLMCLLGSTTTEAQFFKKLVKKVSEEVEESVTKKTSEKTTEEVEDGFDGIFSSKSTNNKPESKSKASHGLFSNSDKPDANYVFKYHYKMKIVSEDQAIAMDYYIEPNSDYLGVAMNQKGMQTFTVLDYYKATLFNFIEYQDQKILTALNLDSTSAVDAESKSFSESEYKVTDLPNKTILGFSCDGKKIENNERQIIIYYTDELEISFAQLIKASKQQNTIPLNFENHLPNADETMLMYMKTTEKNKRKKQVSIMECTAFNEVNRIFNTAGYQSYGN